MRTEIVLSGYGGQGLLMAGTILGDASAIYEGKITTNSQTYGVAARGGESRSEVIISDDPINYSEIEHPDVLLAMSQGALNRFAPQIKKDALVIIDTSLVKDTSAVTNSTNIKGYPITTIATNETGRSILANVVALGIIVELTGVMSLESLEQAVLSKAPKGTGELNKKAMYGGVAAVRADK